MFTAKTLTKNIDKWEVITDNNTVLDWLKHGVLLPFIKSPLPFKFSNRKFTGEEARFIDAEVSRLLKTGCIEINRNSEPCYVSPINVVPKKKGFRLVTDLRYLNEYISPPKFIYEGIEEVLKITKPNDLIITWDLEQGFHHIPVADEHSKYLCFKWKGVHYNWMVTPFGGNFSPYFFCKTVREVIKYLRHNDIKTVAYVDDFYLCDTSEKIDSVVIFIKEQFKNLGWHINIEKSCFTPSYEAKFIGFLILTNVGDNSVWLKVPKSRIDKVKREIKRALNKGCAKARTIARIAGQIVSMTKAVMPAKLLLRNLYRCLKNRKSWNDILILDSEATKDLQWWTKALYVWNGTAFNCELPEITIATDASGEAWGGYILKTDLYAQGYWTVDQSSKSSNFREMLAVHLTLLSLLPHVKNKSISVLSDNVSTVCYINMQGGPATELTRIARAIWSLALKHEITIKAHHLSGRLNQTADGLSRLSSKYEWALNQNLFRYIDRLWGPHTVDRFATMVTTKCQKYNSRFLDPQSSGVNALLQTDWGQENNYVNPPVRLLDQVLDVVCQQQATATIIAPKWEAQLFSQRLRKMSISAPIKLPKPHLFCTKMGIQIPEPLKNKRWTWFAWRICGNRNF